jgi:hypothetical protein
VDFKPTELYQFDFQVAKVPQPTAAEAEGAAPASGGRPPARAAGPLPTRLCRAAAAALALHKKWPRGAWAFDGRAVVYATDSRLVPEAGLEVQLDVALPDEPQVGQPNYRPVRVVVKMARAAIIGAGELPSFLRCAAHVVHVVHHAANALDTRRRVRRGRERESCSAGRCACAAAPHSRPAPPNRPLTHAQQRPRALLSPCSGQTRDTPRHALQALDVALRHRMGLHSAFVPRVMALGRSFLTFSPQTAGPLGGGAEVWLGYKQALRPCQTGLALTLDTAAGAVWAAGDPAGAPRPLSDLM